MKKIILRIIICCILLACTVSIMPNRSVLATTYSITFYPSLDGYVSNFQSPGSWYSLITGVGNGSEGSNYYAGIQFQASTDPLNPWTSLSRGVCVFDTSEIPDGVIISSANLSLYGFVKEDHLTINPDINIYSVNMASPAVLSNSDYSNMGSINYSTTINYADWSTSGYNSFTLNANGLANISLTGNTKLGIRNANYDVSSTEAPGGGGGIYGLSTLLWYTVEQGGGYRPKLTVTFTVNAPTISTQAVTNIASITSTGSGNITNTGGQNADIRGICWNTTGTPTIADNKTQESGSFGIGTFSESMTSLFPNTLYYVRAYAHNYDGYSYGSTVEFTTRHGIPDTSNNLTIGSDATLYILSANVTINGAMAGSWRWALGFTFPDLSGYGHTAYPSIRTTGNAANVTGAIASQQAGQASNQPPQAGSQAWQMITGNESALLKQTPTGLYREGGTTFPGGKAVQDAATAFGYPVEFFLYPLAFGSSILAGVWVMKKTHRPEKGIRGSLLLQSFVSLFVMILWVFGGGGVISGWALIPFGLWIVVLLIFKNPYNPVIS